MGGVDGPRCPVCNVRPMQEHRPFCVVTPAGVGSHIAQPPPAVLARDLIAQIEGAEYRDKHGHPLENNTAFQALKAAVSD